MMMMKHKHLLSILVLSLLLTTEASIIITIREDATGVGIGFSGFLDVTGASPSTFGGTFPSFIQPRGMTFGSGTGTFDLYRINQLDLLFPGIPGFPASLTASSTDPGDLLQIIGTSVEVPTGYSGASISGFMAFDGATLASLGATPGMVGPFTLVGATNPAQAQVSVNIIAAPAAGGANGDPHFLRWGQTKHDSFQGECDLVLVANKKKGIYVALRTRGRKWYSYIYKTAIAIGSRNVELGKNHFLVDGVSITNSTFPMALKDPTHGSITIDKIGEEEFRIGWGTSSSSITVSIIGIFVNVDVQSDGDDFVESVGMMGKYGSGEMLDRQGKSMDPKDMNAFGMEWQVKSDKSDPTLFSTVEGPQWPESGCVMPEWVDTKKKKKKRKLRGDHRNNIGNEKELGGVAKLACIGAADYDLCVKDIVMTGEIGLAKTFVPNKTVTAY